MKLSNELEKRIKKARLKASEYTKKYCPETYSDFQLYERVIEQFQLEYQVLEKENIELQNKYYKLDYEEHNKILTLQCQNKEIEQQNEKLIEWISKNCEQSEIREIEQITGKKFEDLIKE